MKERVETEKDGSWVLPKNLSRQAAAGEGVYGAYDAFAQGSDVSALECHAIVDDAYARLYVENLKHLLARMAVPLRGNILDAGCAIGTITDALRSVADRPGACHGIDLSESAITVARGRYDRCRFDVHSSDDLSIFPDAFFDLIHLREFYPFTRTDDPDLHMRFLDALVRKLKPGGAAACVQIIDREGLADSFAIVRRRSLDSGYRRVLRRVMVPNRTYRKLRPLSYLYLVYPWIALAGHALERIKPGRVTYVYIFQKGDRGYP